MMSIGREEEAPMKKALIAVVAVLVLIAVALVALPFLVPSDEIKTQLMQQVKAATGRDLSIDGKVSVSVFPSLSVQLGNVALSNPPGFAAKDLVRLGELDVKLKLLPLVSGRVEIDSFVLIDPVIALEVSKDGRADWQFGTPAVVPAGTGKEGTGTSSDVKTGSADTLSDIQLGDVRIANGKMTYSDDKTGRNETVESLDLSVSLPSPDQPLSLKGGLKWRGQQVTLGTDIGKPRVLFDGHGSTSASVTIASELEKLAFSGDVKGADKSMVGVLDLSVPSVRGLVSWTTGKPMDAPAGVMGPLSIKGKLTVGNGRFSFTQAALALDAIKAVGDFSVDSGGEIPKIKATLDVESLDLNSYLPAEGQGKANDGKSTVASNPTVDAKQTGAGKKQDWSDDPIDVSPLKIVDADMALSVGSLKFRKIQIGKSRMTVAVHGGKMVADLGEMALYKGSGQGRLALDGAQPSLGLDAQFALKGLQVGAFLADATSSDRVDGMGNLDLQVSGKGGSERQIVSSLAGKGGIAVQNGAIKGVNLMDMVRNVSSAFTDTASSQKTDFGELLGTFTIAAGILSNQDLALKAPALRASGAGTVDLPKRQVHYRVTPKVAATIEGQGGKQDVGGLTVPIIVEGPWDNISYRPDLAGLVKENVGQAVKGIVGGVTGKGGLPSINPSSLFGR